MKTIEIIMYALLIIVICVGLTAFLLTSISDNNCKKLCNEKNALAHQTFPSGGWDTNDICCCIFKDKIKAWRMK